MPRSDVAVPPWASTSSPSCSKISTSIPPERRTSATSSTAVSSTTWEVHIRLHWQWSATSTAASVATGPRAAGPGLRVTAATATPAARPDPSTALHPAPLSSTVRKGKPVHSRSFLARTKRAASPWWTYQPPSWPTAGSLHERPGHSVQRWRMSRTCRPASRRVRPDVAAERRFGPGSLPARRHGHRLGGLRLDREVDRRSGRGRPCRRRAGSASHGHLPRVAGAARHGRRRGLSRGDLSYSDSLGCDHPPPR